MTLSSLWANFLFHLHLHDLHHHHHHFLHLYRYLFYSLIISFPSSFFSPFLSLYSLTSPSTSSLFLTSSSLFFSVISPFFHPNFVILSSFSSFSILLCPFPCLRYFDSYFTSLSLSSFPLLLRIYTFFLLEPPPFSPLSTPISFSFLPSPPHP